MLNSSLIGIGEILKFTVVVGRCGGFNIGLKAPRYLLPSILFSQAALTRPTYEGHLILIKGHTMKLNTIQILQLDYTIQLYTTKLYERAGGHISISYHDTLLVSDQALYSRCYQRAVKRYSR